MYHKLLLTQSSAEKTQRFAELEYGDTMLSGLLRFSLRFFSFKWISTFDTTSYI